MMSMTQRLYYTDSYTKQFNATLVEQQIDGSHLLLKLDQTYFYPGGGGQPHDTGILNDIPVIEVMAQDGVIWHKLAQLPPAPLLPGHTIEGIIDWPRRFDFMQQHTGQHLLTQAFVQIANANTVGFHLTPDNLTIDLDQADLSDTVIADVEALANQIITENRPVTARVLPVDEAEGVRIRRLPGHLATDGLRVIEIANFDSTACGGTHVAHTGEIGLLKITRLEARGFETRVEFRCGGRALRDYQGKHRVISHLALEANGRYEDLPAAFSRLHIDLNAARDRLRIYRDLWVEAQAERLLAGADTARGYRLIVFASPDRDLNDLKLLASRLTTGSRVVALLGSAGEKAALVFARTADVDLDMGSLLKAAASQLGGRGGGQAAFAQGGGMNASLDQVQAALTTLAQSLPDQSA